MGYYCAVDDVHDGSGDDGDGDDRYEVVMMMTVKMKMMTVLLGSKQISAGVIRRLNRDIRQHTVLIFKYIYVSIHHLLQYTYPYYVVWNSLLYC